MTIVWIALAAILVAPAVQAQEFDEAVARVAASVDPARIESTVRKLESFGTRHVLSVTDQEDRGTGAARSWLRSEYSKCTKASGFRLRVETLGARVAVRRRGMPDSVELVNVVATLPGVSDPDRVYVVSGHYDSRNSTGSDGEGLAPGANDDASGTAVALEVCRVLCAQELAATVVFCAYDGEEQGLLGSAAHAKLLANEGVQVDGMITCDIVGNTLGMDGVRRRDYVRCFSYAPTGNDSSGRSLARAMRRGAEHVAGFDVKLVFRGDRYGRGGDHRSFFDAGYPAVRMTEPREDYSRQHQDLTERDGRPYVDLADFVDYPYAAQVARVVAATLFELAQAPPPPLVRAAAGARAAYDTLVDYEMPEGAVGCEFVWRDTTAADWQGVVPEDRVEVAATRPGVFQARLVGLCLDDLVVGVRSVAASGARSRVATPPEPDRYSAAQRQRERSGR